MKRRRQTTKAEPTVSLINIVFLILIFFMVAGTLSTPSERVSFVTTEGLDCCTSPDAVIIDSAGILYVESAIFESAEAFMQSREDKTALIRLLPDRELPANSLLSLIGALKDQGAQQIVIVTEHTA